MADDTGPLRGSSYARPATDDRFRRIAHVWNTYAPPADLYPADIYTIQGDAWADWPSNISTSLRADWDAVYGLLLHEDYLGLTPQEIASATSSIDGLTDYFTIAQPQDALETLLTAVLNALG